MLRQQEVSHVKPQNVRQVQGQGQPEAFADMQLLQTTMQHSQEDSAVNNLQQHGTYMVVSHPADTAAAQDNCHSGQLPDVSCTVAVYSDDQQQCDSNQTGAVKWYGSYGSGVNDAAVASRANGQEDPVWHGQLVLQEAAMAKKGQPADVSRHDTPTSVFDIFNSLDISGTPHSGPVASEQQQDRHNIGTCTGCCFAVVYH